MSRMYLSVVLIFLCSCLTDPRSNSTGVETGGTDSGLLDSDMDGFLRNEDCDDQNPNIYPGADEICNARDDNCDGAIDEEDPLLDLSTLTVWYRDADNDGYGNETDSLTACVAPAWHVEASSAGFDCDDTDPAYHPGADESDCNDPNDYNCDGSVAYADADEDGWPACTECNDADASINPDAIEICDELDNDCDTAIDDLDDSLDTSTTSTWYGDNDGDGFGDSSLTITQCAPPSGYVSDGSDCDDTVSTTFPGADEYCDDLDSDCDDTLDDSDALDTTVWYADNDSDSYGDASATENACDQPSGYVADNTDCDDNSNRVFPGADEYCDNLDNDCDGTTDEDDAIDAITWYADSDNDTFGDPNSSDIDCTQPSGYIADNTDCDDTSSTTFPGATEYCDGHDDNCDGTIDEDSAVDTTIWYTDNDNDSYGVPTPAVNACDQPSGYASVDTDCDDSDSSANPGATETCDGVDNDCDGTADSTSVCPCDVEYNGDSTHPYMFCSNTKSWSAAGSYCQAYNYELVSVTTNAENVWVDNTADSFSTDKWWAGFTDQNSEGSWVWANGETTGYTNWNSNEPNGGTTENCMNMNRFHPTRTWNDGECWTPNYFICEIN